MNKEYIIASESAVDFKHKVVSPYSDGFAFIKSSESGLFYECKETKRTFTINSIDKINVVLGISKIKQRE